MNVAKQLYQLQILDLELDKNEQALQKLVSQLGESQAVAKAQAKLAEERQRLEELEQQQHNAEWEIDDLTVKLSPAEKKLYNGSIKNPKELSNLQHEVDILKGRRSQLEDNALEIMEQIELVKESIANADSELNRLETEWRNQQQHLSGEIERIKVALTDFNHQRQLLATEIDPPIVDRYQKLRRQKGTAVAKLERGVCSGCRISLPASDSQRARSGHLVQCSSCGRILFLA